MDKSEPEVGAGQNFYKLGFGHAPVMSGSTRATEGQRSKSLVVQALRSQQLCMSHYHLVQLLLMMVLRIPSVFQALKKLH